ncbi:hypothetical protein QR680_013339 [Steinernema hermaphroditum]|uniref:Uncharacterized protein n=1 Tax=Steinernema hermaphroditum TaxID=289476 RepID=A0AA39M2C2_9BILA|nr:hypothetical protein QR680_013339 [Steinernema hermaphroditum]
MFPPVLFYVIFVHGLLSNGNVILSLMFNGLSLPLHELFNASVQNQYSISLDDKGMSLVISILPNFEFLGNLACVLLVVPLMDSSEGDSFPFTCDSFSPSPRPVFLLCPLTANLSKPMEA